MMTAFLITAIVMISDLLVLLICIEAFMSWFAASYTGTVRRIYDLLLSVTDPLVYPFRKLLLPLSNRIGIDFSPLAAIIVIEAITRILVQVLSFL